MQLALIVIPHTGIILIINLLILFYKTLTLLVPTAMLIHLSEALKGQRLQQRLQRLQGRSSGAPNKNPKPYLV